MIGIVFSVQSAIGNPDTFSTKVDATRGRMAGGFFRAGFRKQRPVNQSHCRKARRIWDWDRKHAGVLVIDTVQRDAAIGTEGGKAKTAPVEQILGNSDRNAGAVP